MIPQFLTDLADKLVDTFTLGQLNSLVDLFNQYGGGYSVGLVSEGVAVFMVLVKLVVPAIIAFVIVNKLSNRLMGLIASAVTLLLYSVFYANPLTLYSEVSQGTAKLISYLCALPSITYDSFIFTGLTYGPAVFILKLLASFIGVWVMLIAILVMATIFLWAITLGRNVWSITERKLISLTLLMALAFMVFYPVFGSFKAIVSVFTIVVGGINVTEGYFTLKGKEKHCFKLDDGGVKCYWR